MVGLPLNMDGSEGAAGAGDAGLLRAAGGSPGRAGRDLRRAPHDPDGAGQPAGRAGAAEDSLAAAHLLEAYLAAAGEPGEEGDDDA